MDDVTITPLERLSEDERGGNFALETRPRPDFLVIYRKKGTISGDHYHLGRIPEKNPEVIIFLSGEADFSWRRLTEKNVVIRRLVAPCKIEIQPNVWHELVAKTDVVFVEEGCLKPEEYERDTKRL